jgi:hypothetical protein
MAQATGSVQPFGKGEAAQEFGGGLGLLSLALGKGDVDGT